MNWVCCDLDTRHTIKNWAVRRMIVELWFTWQVYLSRRPHLYGIELIQVKLVLLSTQAIHYASHIQVCFLQMFWSCHSEKRPKPSLTPSERVVLDGCYVRGMCWYSSAMSEAHSAMIRQDPPQNFTKELMITAETRQEKTPSEDWKGLMAYGAQWNESHGSLRFVCCFVSFLSPWKWKFQHQPHGIVRRFQPVNLVFPPIAVPFSGFWSVLIVLLGWWCAMWLEPYHALDIIMYKIKYNI